MEAGGGVADRELSDDAGAGAGAAGDDESWTDLEHVRPDLDEALPIRHGMMLGGRYTIEKVLGRGGCGVVVRAHDRVLKEAVAVKIVRAELASEQVWAARLAREVKLARQIQHPHVCRVFDFQQADGRVFLVMELAARGTLREEIRSGALKARPLAERIADARAVASALAAIHQAGIVHRDLTPQNLLRMSDGRVVLTDFGLATDARDGSSVAGGTISYMAPELLRGGRSSFGSDVWALGVVMHEIVFGDKPRWRDGGLAPEMLPPDLGRKLTAEEEIAFEACRACTESDPARRLASPVEAARRLTERAGRRRRPAISRRAALVAGVSLGAVGLVTGLTALNLSMLGAAHHKTEGAPAAAAARAQPGTKPSPLIVPIGAPADWTRVAEVVAEVPDRIHCARLLPDGRTIRFVWGTPTRAEDVDTVTRHRVPSPLAPAAYAEGCPDLSPDGLRLVYQGHVADGRAFAFLSQRPDGRDGVPVVQTAEPSMASEPTWLADGQTFSYDVDPKHMGVFSTALGRMNVLPDVTASPFVTMFRYVLGNRVYLGTQFDRYETEVVGISVPALDEEQRFRVPNLVLDLRQEGRQFYFAQLSKGRTADIIEIDPTLPAARAARPIGHIPDQMLRYPMMTAAGLAFVSVRLSSDLWVRRPNGGDGFTNLTRNGHVRDVNRCGRDLVVSRELEPERTVIERMDWTGKPIEQLSCGPADWSPACSPDGKTWYFRPHLPQPSIRRCDRAGCRDIYQGFAVGLSPSPDGRRLAFVTLDKRGSVVLWIGEGGGTPHEVAETETGCPVGWASDDTIWVSRRRGHTIVWTEVDADSGRETGKTVPGSHDCYDARPDPASPVNPDLRIVYDQTSQVRVVGRERLADAR